MARSLTPEQETFFCENIPGRLNQELAELLNEKYGLSWTSLQVKNYKRNHKLGSSGIPGWFAKGSTPANKGKKFPGTGSRTSFKPGQVSHNKAPVGSEVLRDDGYLWRKIAQPKTWKQVHRILWEDVHGEIPSEHKLLFIDGDRLNISLNNLVLITSAQMLILNRKGLIYNDPELTKTGVNIAQVLEKMGQRVKRGG